MKAEDFYDLDKRESERIASEILEWEEVCPVCRGDKPANTNCFECKGEGFIKYER